MRTCNKCHVNKTRSDNQYKCNKCHNEYMKAYHKKNGYTGPKAHKEKIRSIVKEAKNKPCMDCGNNFPWYVMDLDHVRGTKKFELSVACSKRYALKTIYEELEKCEAVCSNCHRIRTWNRSGATAARDTLNVSDKGPNPFSCT